MTMRVKNNKTKSKLHQSNTTASIKPIKNTKRIVNTGSSSSDHVMPPEEEAEIFLNSLLSSSHPQSDHNHATSQSPTRLTHSLLSDHGKIPNGKNYLAFQFLISFLSFSFLFHPFLSFYLFSFSLHATDHTNHSLKNEQKRLTHFHIKRNDFSTIGYGFHISPFFFICFYISSSITFLNKWWYVHGTLIMSMNRYISFGIYMISCHKYHVLYSPRLFGLLILYQRIRNFS